MVINIPQRTKKMLFLLIISVAAVSSILTIWSRQETDSSQPAKILTGSWMSSPEFCSAAYQPESLMVFSLKPGIFTVSSTDMPQEMRQAVVATERDLPDQIVGYIDECEPLKEFIAGTSEGRWHRFELVRRSSGRTFYWYGSKRFSKLPQTAQGLLVEAGETLSIYEPYNSQKILANSDPIFTE